MLLKKTLAYGDGEARKPERKKKLAFLLGALSLAGCVSHAAPVTTVVPAAARTRPPAAETVRRESCGSDLDGLLRPDERRLEAVCRFGREYIMTDSSLLIIVRTPEQQFNFDPISLRMAASRTDIRDYARRGIVDWEPTENSVAILTQSDRMLTIIPNEEMGTTVPAYEMPFDITALARNRMAYFSRFLFIAPLEGQAIAMSLDGQVSSRYIPVGPGQRESGFFEANGRLFFGKDGRSAAEIRINGASVDDVEIIRERK